MPLVYAGVCSHAPGIRGRKDLADPEVRDAFYGAFDGMRADLEASGAEASSSSGFAPPERLQP